ncbi:MAG TPA: trehalose-phosphatase [Paracoccaceae bacterium]|nr:trehalose-phosphatase [Paracoccaceae bacterium]
MTPPELDLQRTALFLDFDGTLARIVPRPELAVLSSATRRALARLQEGTCGAIAVLSGRDLGDLERHLAPLALPAAGSHGLEWRDAGGHVHPVPPPDGALAEAMRELSAFAEAHGLFVEHKRGGASLHYRSHPELGADCRKLGDRIRRRSPGLRVLRGHMVVEVTLAGRDKGHALAAFMEGPPFRGRVPVAVGDDVTDEDAFAAAQRLGGAGIKIGPGATRAQHRMPDFDAFHAWLNELADGLHKPRQKDEAT